MTNDDKRRSAHQTGWLRYNRYKEKGYGILVSDLDGREVFAHVRGYYGYPVVIGDAEIRALEYRRRLKFRLRFDAKSDRICADDIVPLPELMGPNGEIIALSPQQHAEAPKPEPRTSFGALVAALR